MRTIWLAVALLLAGPSMAAGIYKWVDANGVTHYAESSPENVPASEVEIEPPPAPEMVEEARRRLQQSEQRWQSRSETFAQQRQRQKEAREASAREARQRRERCGHALVQLRVLARGEPVYRDEAGAFHAQKSAHSASYEGKRSYLDDAARAIERARFQKMADENCGDDDEAKDQRWLERRLADYHRRQCEAARELLIELKGEGAVADRDEILLELDRDIDRHCITAKLRR